MLFFVILQHGAKHPLNTSALFHHYLKKEYVHRLRHFNHKSQVPQPCSLVYVSYNTVCAKIFSATNPYTPTLLDLKDNAYTYQLLNDTYFCG